MRRRDTSRRRSSFGSHEVKGELFTAEVAENAESSGFSIFLTVEACRIRGCGSENEVAVIGFPFHFELCRASCFSSPRSRRTLR